MVLRKPPPGKDWDPFWGCNRFPDCHGKRAINPDGTFESDEEWEEYEFARPGSGR